MRTTALLATVLALGCGSADPASAGASSAGGSGSGSTAGSAGTPGSGGALGAGNGGGGSETGGGTAGGGASGTAGGGGAPPVTSPALRWLGRIEEVADGARFAWPGTGFEARFSGTTATATITTGIDDFFQIAIDGDDSVLETMPGTHEYVLASGLEPGEHELVLWRRTESSAGAVTVGAVGFGADGQLLAPRPRERRLEIIGDSISAGYGVDCSSNAEPFSYPTENHYLTYGALAARELDAELHTLAWSGLGMVRDYAGQTNEQMPERYERTIGTEATSTWDFSRYSPHAVIVHLGTNDFATGDPGPVFAETYLTFVEGLRSRYATARVYLAVSPMLSGSSRASLKSYLEQVLAARTQAGDTNLALIEFQPPTAEEGWGCDWHPNAATQATMGQLLVATLTSDLGWQ